MAAQRSSGTRNQMIHCPYCGEDYAASYKHCPFCDEQPQDENCEYDEEADGSVKGGKRLINNTRGGGYGGGPSVFKVIGTVISLALIVAAVIIVISIIKPLVDKGHTALESPSPGVEDASPNPDADASPAPDDADPSPDLPDGSADDSSPQIPEGQTATGFTINREDFTMSKAGETWNLEPTFTPAGTTGTITWVSDKPEVATVNDYGVVTAISKGTANITATLAGGFTQTCIVRCNFEGTASSGSDTATQSSGSLSLNHVDFTFSSLNDVPVTMRVSGTSSTPTWSIGNTSVATISEDGVVRPVGKGTTTITCTVDGQTLTCIVRCSF